MAKTIKDKMTDQQIISAVLTSCGWTRQTSIDCFREWVTSNGDVVQAGKEPPILTSLDACHEVFEKDAPDGYWDTLGDVIDEEVPVKEWHYFYSVLKATPRQRCLAWLKFKGVKRK